MIEIYTDGSTKHNGSINNRGGWGLAVIQNGVLLETYNESSFNTTNNREEIKAILKAFELAQTKYKNEECIIYSDSLYVVNICNDWIYKWARNNWINSKKQIIENLDLVKDLYKYINIDFFNCQVVYCKSHCGILGNELADALAQSNTNKFKNLILNNNICVDKNLT